MYGCEYWTKNNKIVETESTSDVVSKKKNVERMNPEQKKFTRY